MRTVLIAALITGAPFVLGFLIGKVWFTLGREWILRRYIEADYRFLEARSLNWWDSRYIMRLYRRREFWKRLRGRV